jgi:hypothetical protein
MPTLPHLAVDGSHVTQIAARKEINDAENTLSPEQLNVPAEKVLRFPKEEGSTVRFWRNELKPEKG